MLAVVSNVMDEIRQSVLRESADHMESVKDEMAKNIYSQLSDMNWKCQNEVLEKVATMVDDNREQYLKLLKSQLQQAQKYRKPFFKRFF